METETSEVSVHPRECMQPLSPLFIYLFIYDLLLRYSYNTRAVTKMFQQPIYNSITLIIHVCACETGKGISSEK